MNVFIVYAHPEPTSFNGAMLRKAVEAMSDGGHRVAVSDLYEMKFDPVTDRRNFLTTADPNRLNLQDEEGFASQNDSFAPELRAEMEKLAWCDLLILQFPLFWLGPPAILKGWIDRVLARGFAYGGGRRFETGVFKGKSALCALTVGGPASAYSPSGPYADLDTVLFGLSRGVLEFCGFSVLAPHAAFGMNRASEEIRAAELERYGRRIAEIAALGPR